jgi:hypothetical protein
LPPHPKLQVRHGASQRRIIETVSPSIQAVSQCSFKGLSVLIASAMPIASDIGRISHDRGYEIDKFLTASSAFAGASTISLESALLAPAKKISAG